MNAVNEFLGTGRRKKAIARVRLAAGTGTITVNGRAFEHYFPLESYRTQVSQPLTVTDTAAKFDVRIIVTGGGPAGQAGAVRHGIARALLKNAPVLILDEATSHLDAVNEQAVRRALDLLQADRTTIVIAHRLSTVRDADLIVVLEQGRVAETGSHAELLSRGGLYAQLVSRQLAGAYAPAAQ